MILTFFFHENLINPYENIKVLHDIIYLVNRKSQAFLIKGFN